MVKKRKNKRKRGGRVFKPKYAVRDANGVVRKVDGTPVYRECRTYSIEFTTAQGRTKRMRAGTDAGQAEDYLKLMQAKVVKERNSIITGSNIKEKIDLSGLIKEYLKVKEGKNLNITHLRNLRHRLYDIQNSTGVVDIEQLSAKVLDKFLASLGKTELAIRGYRGAGNFRT